MKKGYLVGGLAIVGAIALIAYLKPKPKKHSAGCFSGAGKRSLLAGRNPTTSIGRCTVCYDNYSSNNNYQNTYYAVNGMCRSGDRCKY